MKRIYSNPNSMLVGLIQGKLASEGIEATIKNDNTQGASGELAPTDCWPEIWLENQRNMKKAMQIIEGFNEEENQESWQCKNCDEVNEGNFESCWNCQTLNY